MKKQGFSVVELIITCIIMVVVCIATPLIVFKKSVKEQTVQQLHALCECFDGSESNEACANLGTRDGRTYCKFIADNTDTEFYSLNITGGGAAASSASSDGVAGLAGETKSVFYPSLSGTYCIRTGAGGDFSQTDENKRNGQDTIILHFEKDEAAPDCASANYDGDNAHLFEFAMGGISSNETVRANLSSDDKTKATQEQPSGDTRFGAGGAKGASGKSGGVSIRW